MEPFKRILVDIDASVPSHPALDRAAHLARRSGAKLTIVDTTTVSPYARRSFPADVEENMLDQRREELQRIARGVRDVAVSSMLLVGRPSTVLIQEILRSGHDLLVRSHARDRAASRATSFGAIDMQLLRTCPCPVLLVGPGHHSAHPKIVGAVNTSTEDTAEQALNVKIAELTLLMARLEEGSPLLLQAWAPFAERVVRTHASAEAFAAYVEDVRKRTMEDFARLTSSLGLVRAQTILRRGAPEDIIPGLVVAQGIDLVVIGTVARAGIAGFLIGNTAERVLGRLSCSVLAVKPQEFVCPVRRDAV